MKNGQPDTSPRMLAMQRVMRALGQLSPNDRVKVLRALSELAEGDTGVTAADHVSRGGPDPLAISSVKGPRA
jgi:hypothetical protein